MIRPAGRLFGCGRWWAARPRSTSSWGPRRQVFVGGAERGGPEGLGVEWDDARPAQGEVLLGRQAGGLLHHGGQPGRRRGALRASGLAGHGAAAHHV